MSHSFESSIPFNTEADAQSVSVTIRLPLDIAAELRQHARQHGQNPSQVMSNALRQYFGLSHSLKGRSVNITAAEWQRVMDRLSRLESLVPKVEQLEHMAAALADGRAIAPAEQSDLDPPGAIEPIESSVPAGNDAADPCPKCNNRLGPPLKASGRQVCSKCGWTNKPRHGSSHVQPIDLSTDELQRMLNQAADESLENMKPNKSHNPKPPGNGNSFPFFRR